MSSDTVLAVMTNWRRPANLRRIAEALRANSHPPTRLILMNNSGVPFTAAPAGLFDDVFSANTNLGPSCRFVPALAFYDCKWCLFCDDDFLPGPKSIEHFVATAHRLENKFSTLGEIGRVFRRVTEERWSYRPRNIRRDRDQPVPVDMECRAHFLLTENVRHAINFNWALLREFGEAAMPGVLHHDDLSLCMGAQRATGHRSYLTTIATREHEICMQELPDGHAASSRGSHRAERTTMIEQAVKIGWKSPLRWPDQKGVE